MKQLLRKKWFRILLRTVVVVVTLLVLAVSIFNWQAAKRKERAMAEAKNSGMALSAADLTAGMPPDDLNFARHGIFALLEDGLALPEDQKSADQRDVIGRYNEVGDEALFLALNRKRENRAGPVDFSFLPDDRSYGKSAESFLAEFDRRHGAVLAEIRAAMVQPHVRRTAIPQNFDDGDGWLKLNEGFGFMTMRAQKGLRLRAEAALATGDSAKAAESVEMIARLGELVGSRGLLVSTMIEFAAYQIVKDEVKRGSEMGAWTIADLDRISAAVTRWDVRARLVTGAHSEAIMVQVFDAWKRDRGGIAPYLAAGVFGGKMDAKPGILPRIAAQLLPDGIFDRASAANLENLHAVLAILQDPAPAGPWAEAADKLRNSQGGEGALTSILNGATGAAAMLDLGSRALMRRQLILAACAIERHRLTNGAYPESLAGFPAENVVDPLLGGTLGYQRSETSFRLFSPGRPSKEEDVTPNPRSKDWVW